MLELEPLGKDTMHSRGIVALPMCFGHHLLLA